MVLDLLFAPSTYGLLGRTCRYIWICNKLPIGIEPNFHRSSTPARISVEYIIKVRGGCSRYIYGKCEGSSGLTHASHNLFWFYLFTRIYIYFPTMKTYYFSMLCFFLLDVVIHYCHFFVVEKPNRIDWGRFDFTYCGWCPTLLFFLDRKFYFFLLPMALLFIYVANVPECWNRCTGNGQSTMNDQLYSNSEVEFGNI